MKISIKSEKPLKDLERDTWEGIFVETVEVPEDIIRVGVVEFKGDDGAYLQAEDAEDIVEFITNLMKNEAKDYKEVDLTLDLKENFYDENDNLLDAEVEVSADDEIEAKFYYNAGNFLKKEKVYTKVHSAH